MDLMSMVMRSLLSTWRARKAVATSANSSAASIWAQCPQFGKTCRVARGIALSATSAPSSGLTRSSRPQVSRVCLRILWASRQSMPSSAVSGLQKDMPIEIIASRAPGAVASAYRSSTSSSVTRSWLTTMVEMNARSASRLGLAG